MIGEWCADWSSSFQILSNNNIPPLSLVLHQNQTDHFLPRMQRIIPRGLPCRHKHRND